MFLSNCKSRILVFLGRQRRTSAVENSISSSSYLNLFNCKIRSFCSLQNRHFEALRMAMLNAYSKEDFSELGPPMSESADTQPKLVKEKAKADTADIASLSSFQYQGFEPSRRAVHNFSSEDDFSELGAPLAETAPTQLKLVTEKPDHFLKTDSARGLTDIFLGLHKTSQTSNGKFHNRHDVKRQNSSKIDSSSCSMSSENVLDVGDWYEVDSENPESSGRELQSHRRRTSQTADGKFHNRHDLNWKNSLKGYSSSSSISNENMLDGRDRAEVDSVNLERTGRELQNCPLDAMKNVTIRIQGIRKETTDPMIHSICKSNGALEGFARVDKDSVDALFRVTNDTDAQGLVQRLNNVVIDNSHWAASEISRESTASEEVGSMFVLQINSRLAELKRQLDYKRIYFEDLQLLHMGVLHLEGLSTVTNPSDED